MESNGLLFAFVGAGLLFYADWQNWPVDSIAILMFVVSAVVGFCVSRWRVQISLFLTLSLIGAEWAAEHLKAWKTDLSASVPNLFVLAGLAFILAVTASLIGGGLRSFFDAGRR